MRFIQFYAGTAVCAPSRASFMTGRHTGHTPVRGNRGFQPEGQFPLPDSTVTIARRLQDMGYYTADFGKWGLGYPGSSGVPSKQGFDTFFGYNCQSQAHNYYPDHLWQNDQRVELTENKTGDVIYSADLFHGHALEFFRQRKNGPFFLFLSYTLPHAALSVPHDTVYDHYVRKFNESPRNQAETPRFEKAAFEPYPHAAYAAMVTRLDRYVGEVRALLDSLGIARNTLVIFSSDNGPHKEGGNDPDFFDSNGPLRGIKRDLYEGGIREPFIACWPGKIQAGAVSGFAGAFWDLYPSFCEVAGRKVEVAGGKRDATGGRPGPAIDGISILPTLTGDTAHQRQHDYLYWEFHENGGRQAIRWGIWKGVRLNVHDNPDAPVELYDLTRDPAEMHDLAREYPKIAQQILLLMNKAHVTDKNWPLFASEGKMD